QRTLAVDRFAIGVDHPSQPAGRWKGGAVMTLEDGLAAQPHPAQLSERETEGMPVLEADDFRGEKRPLAGFDLHPAPDAQFAHRADNLDQEALHRFDPAEHLDIVDRLDCRDQPLHVASVSVHWLGRLWFLRRSNRG